MATDEHRIQQEAHRQLDTHPEEVALVLNDTQRVGTAISDTADSSELTTEEHVREYFSDIPVMIEIARCESTFRHRDKNGNLLRGVVNRGDVGVMQINEYYHLSDSKKLGIDIHTRTGNMEFARHLYRTQGVQPWSASYPCWKDAYHGDELAMR